MLIANQESPQSLGLFASGREAAALSRQTRQTPPRSDHTSSHVSRAQSVKAVSPRQSNIPYSTLAAAPNLSNTGRTTSKLTTYKHTLVKPTNPDHKYWCTACDNHSFRHSDGWKKHEKEHETKYVCMLKGLFEITEDGRRCVLCGALNQPASHHSAHNVRPCLEASNRPSFKRRYDMVGHLKDAHDISNGGIVADKWRCRSSKKAWSCGFCVQSFTTLQHRLKHIGTEHFEKGSCMHDWDLTNVVKGLLLQPEIQEAWQNLLKSLDPFCPSEFKWNKSGNKDLQYRLEKGLTDKVTPKSLAQAAYDVADHDWSPAQAGAVASAATISMTLNQYTSPVQHQFRSSPQNQASQIPESSPTDAQRLYVTATSSSSPAHFVPSLDYGQVWEPLASDTDDMNSPQPTTPFNDNKFYPTNPAVYTHWNGYNITNDPTNSNQEAFHHKSNDEFDWSAMSHPDIDIDIGDPTLKRKRDSTSSPAARGCERLLTDKPRREAYRKASKDYDTAWRSLGLDYERQEKYDDEEIRNEMGTNQYLEDSLYN